MFQDDPEVPPLCVRVSPYGFIQVSLYPPRCCVQRERQRAREGERQREKKGKEKRERELSGWGGVREGRMDVFDG